MTRAILTEALLFLVPFALFALVLVLKRRNPLVASAWSGSVSWLVLAGLACAVGAILAFGILRTPQTGDYVPPHLENGRLVPGHFR